MPRDVYPNPKFLIYWTAYVQTRRPGLVADVLLWCELNDIHEKHEKRAVLDLVNRLRGFEEKAEAAKAREAVRDQQAKARMGR